MAYTAKQMMAVTLSRFIEDGKTYIIGTGLPLIGATLAKNTHAPHARLIVEAAIFDGNPQEVPTSVSDLRIHNQASVLWPQYRYVGFQTVSAKTGAVDAGFLGGAQIDPYGNLNSTSIGDYKRPVTRFSGSGGANGIATFCDTIIIMKHEARRFVEHVDYITSPGWVDGEGGRRARGLNDKGPRAVVTELGVMKFDDETKRMYLAEYYPGVSLDTIRERTGFELDMSRAVETPPPSEEVLDVLVHQVDPMRLMV